MNGIFKRNQSIAVTFSDIDGYEIACRRHGTRQKITAVQAETVTDSIAFCHKCLSIEARIMNSETHQTP